jgi:hypothetical protein
MPGCQESWNHDEGALVWYAQNEHAVSDQIYSEVPVCSLRMGMHSDYELEPCRGVEPSVCRVSYLVNKHVGQDWT